MRAQGLLAVLLVAAATPAAADPSYAIVVGSNPGGAGQTELRFAEDDARRVADLLTDLGGYAAADVTTIVRPDPEAVNAAIDALAARVRAAADAGTPATVFFYYSGHAKAAALSLGDHELPLAGLREKLLALPSALTIVVLDACQSGAFSRVKGAEPAADFSFNSRSRLDATGVAVLASSTGSELSQESDLLGGSYFTHHLLVGLRGAADGSGDGRVTIDEAYRYAYHQTLLATAATAVGSQHVSLEVDLKGHGEVPLSYPAKATAQLELPADLAGEILVERTAAQAVLAELYKAAGKPVRVAVAPGEYAVIVRRDRTMSRCPLAVRAGATATLDPATCVDVPEVDTLAKGGGGAGQGGRLALGIALGVGAEMHDAYTDRLADFGYGDATLGTTLIRMSARWRLAPHVEVGGGLGLTGSPAHSRAVTGTDQRLEFSWLTTSLIGFARVAHRPSLTPHTTLYLQAGGGVGIARSKLVDENDRPFTETHVGVVLSGAAGLDWDLPWWRAVSVGLGYGFELSPILENLAGDRHLGVGHFVAVTVGYRP